MELQGLKIKEFAVEFERGLCLRVWPVWLVESTPSPQSRRSWPRRDLVTIVGPGGIGKTTVAVAVAHEMRSVFNSQIRFVDLGSLGAAPLVAPAVAASFGLVIQTNDVVPALVDRMPEAPTLLVLDGCEHVIDGVSALAEKLFQRVPTLHLLATSREAMRVDGRIRL